MKTFEWVMLVISLVFIAMLFGLKVNFKPFKISLEEWKHGLGWLLVIIGIGLLLINRGSKEYLKGYKEGLEDGSQLMIDKINKAVDSINKQKEEGKDTITVNL